MFLSSLLIDTGENPDRPRPGRLWLRNMYRVHQRLCMAFPTAARSENDPQFVQPYQRDDFIHVHGCRTNDQAFLFRVDSLAGGRVVVLIQSAIKPDWDYGFHNAQHLLAAPPAIKLFDPQLAAGQRARFRLQANPTKRLRRESPNASGDPTPQQWVGKRVAVPADKLQDWLARRAESYGFHLRELTELCPGYVYVSRTPESAGGLRLRSVRYEGLLEVTDSESLERAIIRGIGPAKAFGFGLLSLAPVR